MDNILLDGNDIEMIVASSTFEMKYMKEVEYILGVVIHHDHSKSLLNMSQDTYIKNVIKHFRMDNTKHVDTPINRNQILSK